MPLSKDSSTRSFEPITADNEGDEEQPKEEKNGPAKGGQFAQNLFDARVVFVTGEVNQKMAKEACSQLFALSQHSNDPITVFVSSPGGHVESGDMIHDTIKFVRAPVRTLGSGWVASAGALIFAAAKKENRVCLPNTRFLLHQPSGGVGGHPTDIEIQVREITRMRERLNKIFSVATGQLLERIEKDTDRDYWLTAQEAIDYGLVSRIVTSMNDLD